MADENSNVPPSDTPTPPQVPIGIPTQGSPDSIKVEPRVEAPVVNRTLDTIKIQPKKETVRITLPPKPTSAPTVKIPTPAAAAPTGTAAPVASHAAPPLPGSAATGGGAAIPPSPNLKKKPTVPARIDKLDIGLAVAAAVAGLAALVRVFMLGSS